MTEHNRTIVEADPRVPLFRVTRDFDATVDQVVRAHTDPEPYARWSGTNESRIVIDHWDARTGGSWRFTDREHGFHGCFHEVGADRLVQTFTWEGMPQAVSLETMTFTDLGDGRTRLVAESLTDSFEGRDAMLASGMETGIDEGYAKLDTLLADGAV